MDDVRDPVGLVVTGDEHSNFLRRRRVGEKRVYRTRLQGATNLSRIVNKAMSTMINHPARLAHQITSPTPSGAPPATSYFSRQGGCVDAQANVILVSSDTVCGESCHSSITEPARRGSPRSEKLTSIEHF